MMYTRPPSQIQLTRGLRERAVSKRPRENLDGLRQIRFLQPIDRSCGLVVPTRHAQSLSTRRPEFERWSNRPLLPRSTGSIRS